MKIKSTSRSNALLAMLQDNARLRKEVWANSQELFIYYAWPGGYPIFYFTEDNTIICPTCANDKEKNDSHNPNWSSEYIIDYGINWEDDYLYCDCCNEQIESAYGENN